MLLRANTLLGRRTRSSTQKGLAVIFLVVASCGFLVLGSVGLRLVQVGMTWMQYLTGGMATSLPMVNPNWGLERYRAFVAPIETVVFGLPWLWPLVGALGLLLWPTRHQAATIKAPRWVVVAALSLLVAAALMGVRIRVAPLLNFEQALTWGSDYDEGVYVSSAREMVQGHVPYRDFWLAHPPTGVALLAPVAAWSDTGAEALVNARRATAVLDLLAGLLILWAGWELGGVGVGLVAAAIYWLDSTTGRNSTQVWLETDINVWSTAALGCMARGLRLDRARWLGLAGSLAVLAATTKFVGAALLLAMLVGLVLARRWRMLGALSIGTGIALLLFGLFWLPAGWGNIIRQTLIMQLLRSVQEINAVEIAALAFHNPASSSTVLLGMVGALAVLLVRLAQRVGWAVVLLWIMFVLAFFVASPSFYLHYLTQLIAPLAVLGGGVVLLWSQQRWRLSALGALALSLVLAPLISWEQSHLPQPDPGTDWIASAATIRERIRADQGLMAFEPTYNLLSDRPHVQAPDGLLFIDSYMHLRGLGNDIAQRSWAELWRAAVLKQPLAPRPLHDFVALMLQQAPAAAFNEFRPPPGVEHVVTLGRDFREYPLALGSVYQRTDQPRQFEVKTLRVRGVLVPATTIAGNDLKVTILWQMREPEERTPHMSLQLLDVNNHKWAQYDKEVGPEGAPFWAWQAGPKTYPDEVKLPIDSQTPPGSYRLVLVVYDPTNGQPWIFRTPEGQPIGPLVQLETIEVLQR